MKVKSTTQEKGENFEKPCIEEDMYEATLKDVKEISEGEYGSRAALIYTIESKEVDVPMIVYTSHPATKNNKLGQTIMAHGVELNDSEIELDNLIGTKARVLVENYSYDDNGEKKEASSISKVKPLSKE